MKEIKSVRVRRKFTTSNENFTGFSDHKVTLYDNGGNSFKVGVVQTGRKEEFAEYKKEGRFNNFSNDDFIGDGINVLISKQNNNEVFEIIQDPWLDIPPKRRNFGYDSYYLNNGSEVTINWTQNEKSVGGVKWSNDDGMELLVSKGGESKSTIIKTVTIFAPDSYQGENKTLKITRLGIEYLFTDTKDYEYSGLVLDKEILNDVISRWNSKVPNYTLSLCDPDYIKCEIIPYISPVDELENIDKKLETPEETKSIKEKLNVIIPKDLQIKVRQDVSFKIFVGEPPKTEKPFVDGFDFGDGDDLSDLLLEDEFREVEFEGLSESESLLQEEISKGQQSFDKGTTPPLPDKINISISRNLDDLLKEADKAARILGKNPRVKYENLIQGYNENIHGLCPQGTQAVLVALTGIKELGLIYGNADWFSFKNPATGGSAHSTGKGFDKSINGKSYYNEKIRISQINGSWKGTYLQDRKLWQVGDIIAMGYTAEEYGHIQIWTGYSWMSDFKQNAIQQKNVDPNTVALWRFNENGINLIKNKKNIALVYTQKESSNLFQNVLKLQK
jgi:hypothetical protein